MDDVRQLSPGDEGPGLCGSEQVGCGVLHPMGDVESVLLPKRSLVHVLPCRYGSVWNKYLVAYGNGRIWEKVLTHIYEIPNCDPRPVSVD